MQQFSVKGMSCAACQSRVEKAVSKLSGVSSCSVSLLTNSMNVEGNVNTDDIINAVKNAGYEASLKGSNSNQETPGSTNEINFDEETSNLKKRLLSSLIFLILLMYFSMGHTMFNLPLPDFFKGNYIAIGITQLILAAIVMIINQKFFISGFKAILNLAPNMDTLVALGSGASFVYSTYALFAMTDAQINGDITMTKSYLHEFYFESAAMILALITVGKMLEAHSKGKTTDALKSLINLNPKNATIIKDGQEITISTNGIKKGDVFIVKPGESVPIDGVILEGACAVNESALTGESIPVDKTNEDNVYAATIIQSGFIKCKATKTSEETALAQIIKLVSEAATTKAPIAKVADKVSGVFVPIVVGISLITAIIWLLCGETIGFSLARAISVLVISCPCALGLATPVAIMVGNGVGAKNGILFKTAASLEETGRIQIVALDKTGTITTGEPVVTDIIPFDNISENELISTAYSLEIKSEHPLAKAIVSYAKDISAPLYDSNDFKNIAGSGLTATISENTVWGGNEIYISKKTTLPLAIKEKATELAKQGKTPLFFANNKTFLGIIAVADRVKDDSASAIKELRNMGIQVVMLTGDNSYTANAMAKSVGIDEVVAGVLPDGKAKTISNLKRKGKTAMVGDGINDAPALTTADIGIAIGAGTDIAIDVADVVLMKNNLSDVPAAIRLSRKVLKNIHENLFWAFIYNTIGIPLAAGVWIPLLGLKLNPMFGAAAMSLSSFCVVTNALRLNLFNIRNSAKDKKIKQKKEKKSMEKTLKIEGMMCGHCEARVKKCLEGIEGVKEAIVSHEAGTATVILEKDVADDVLKKTVEDQGYDVID